MLHLTFLGTSAGMPTKHRNVTALAVSTVNLPTKHKVESTVSEVIKTDSVSNDIDNQTAKRYSKSPWVLIDCGEATQHQLLQTPLAVRQLAAICITHVHGDHCYGLPGLLASMAMANRKGELTVLAPKAIKGMLDAIQIATDLTLPYPIRFIAIEDALTELNNMADSDNEANEADSEKDDQTCNTVLTLKFSHTHKLDIGITALSHRVPSYAFLLTQHLSTVTLDTDKLIAHQIPAGPSWGKIQQGQDVCLEDGQQILADDFLHRQKQRIKIVVGGDNAEPQLLANTVKGAQLMVHEATYTQAVADGIAARPGSYDPMHSTAKSTASFAQANSVPNLILTHFSARYQPFDDPDSKIANMADIRLEAQQSYQGNLYLARDFSQFVVEADGSVQCLKVYSA